MGAWGAASFENDAASDWFYLLEEAIDPGAVIAAALDDAVGEAESLDLDLSWEAIAAAELSASCAGQSPVRLPDNVRRWVEGHPHRPHDAEIDRALQAVTRVRAESELRELWNATAEGRETEWNREVDGLIDRLRRSGEGDPATLSP